MWEVITWIIVAIVVIAIDIVTSSFIFMWFSIGALVAIILSLIGVSVTWQIVAFLIIGVATVSIGYPWAKKKFKADVNHVKTMEQNYIGMVMTAEEDMGETSKIKVSGIYWTAYNKGKIIKKGEQYTIIGIEGNKLVVSLKED
ncbi:NfeD family protein [Clostridium celatum]|uniref:Nodulation efficiency protein D n=1 Tax=Clostridium celatum DSM 1785 TaxID=545697 RepID=L1QE80_9CLOT|nr:NfeD family protein [Clostridium celatum]EKY26256.1 nodulation efficiency protein D [Clostridium celatum DSM 1785]MCE9654016.1 NfeD family protein [Clostridium celatum]MDU2265012.1 NfeD family protein [Clostridium celatum]MDU3723605.1 NfeD family protein [Clostridium celatum]MDU6294310.1 NfeD family protein [Clostridium celatum]